MAVAVAAVVVAAVAAVAVVAARSRHAYANVFCLRKPVVITEGASIQTRVKRRHENRGAPALGCIRGELFLRNCAFGRFVVLENVEKQTQFHLSVRRVLY